MKRLLLILVLTALPLTLTAQSSSLDRIFDDYAGRKEYQSLIYGKAMLSMMKENASSDVQALLDGIKVIRIISYKGQADTLCDKVQAAIRGGHDRISTISGDGRTSTFYIYEPDNKRKDMSFVMTILGPEESVVMEIIGRFDVKDISRLSVIGQKK